MIYKKTIQFWFLDCPKIVCFNSITLFKIGSFFLLWSVSLPFKFLQPNTPSQLASLFYKFVKCLVWPPKEIKNIYLLTFYMAFIAVHGHSKLTNHPTKICSLKPWYFRQRIKERIMILSPIKENIIIHSHIKENIKIHSRIKENIIIHSHIKENIIVHYTIKENIK